MLRESSSEYNSPHYSGHSLRGSSSRRVLQRPLSKSWPEWSQTSIWWTSRWCVRGVRGGPTSGVTTGRSLTALWTARPTSSAILLRQRACVTGTGLGALDNDKPPRTAGNRGFGNEAGKGSTFNRAAASSGARSCKVSRSICSPLLIALHAEPRSHRTTMLPCRRTNQIWEFHHGLQKILGAYRR